MSNLWTTTTWFDIWDDWIFFLEALSSNVSGNAVDPLFLFWPLNAIDISCMWLQDMTTGEQDKIGEEISMFLMSRALIEKSWIRDRISVFTILCYVWLVRYD